MTPLSTEQRNEGLKAMHDENLTRAARVRKQFKTGRPRRERKHNALSAIGEMCDHLDRLRDMQREAGLDAKDVHAAIVWRAADVDGLDKTFYRWLLGTERIPAMVERLLQFQNPTMLGIMFEQADRDKKKDQFAVWIFPFLGDDASQKLLTKARTLYVAGGRAKTEN